MAPVARRPDDLVGLAEQLLGLVVTSLRCAHEPQREPARRVGPDVARSRRVWRASSASRSASSSLPSSSSTWARSRWLSTRVPAVLDGLEDPDRVAQECIRARQIAPFPDGDREIVQRTSVRQRGPASAKRTRAWSSADFRLVPATLEQRVAPGSPERPAADRRARRLERHLGRARELASARSGSSRWSRMSASSISTAACEVATARPLGDREPLRREPLDVREISLPPARVTDHLERIEASPVVVLVDDAERLARELAGASRCRRRGRERPWRGRSARDPRCGRRPPRARRR